MKELFVKYLNENNWNINSTLEEISSLEKNQIDVLYHKWKIRFPDGKIELFINLIRGLTKGSKINFHLAVMRKAAYSAYYDRRLFTIMYYYVVIEGYLKSQERDLKEGKKDLNWLFRKCINQLVWGHRIAEFILRHTNHENKSEKVKRGSSLRQISKTFFCKLLADSKVDPQGGFEDNGKYVKRMCLRYNLKYAERMRIDFTNNFTSSKRRSEYLREIKKFIYPNLDKLQRQKIDSYIKLNNL